jgi:hypothetical protein
MYQPNGYLGAQSSSGLMSIIYSQAQAVTAWLGPETENSHEAVSFLPEIHTGVVSVAECDRLEF